MGSNSVTKPTLGKNSFQIDCSGGTGDTYGILGGSVNGSNTTFTVSLGSYVSGSLEVQLNGQLLTQGDSEDWTETSPSGGTFTFDIAPEVGDIIIVKYQYQTVTTGNADTLDGHHSTDFITNTVAGEFENKIIDATKNTISNLDVDNLASGVLDTDLSSASASDDTIPSAKATKAMGDLKLPLAGGTMSGNIVMGGHGITGAVIDGDDNTLQDISSESLKPTVAFSAYRATGSGKQSISDVTWTKIQGDTEDFDYGSDYDSSTNYRFTAPVNGIYHFDGEILLESLVDGARGIASLYKNGSEWKRGIDTKLGGASALGVIVSYTGYLAKNDYVELYVYYDGTGAVNSSNGAAFGYFSGFLVGKTS